ncbi:MAG: HAMP domain-containing histidine kinase, partial [Bacteroidales bacterium]|nr:HAMP domain-containing histidine kinase [Bacteroidales bacterium]
DKEQLNSVLTNLIRNSVQAIPSNRGGKVSIGMEKTGDSVTIAISDDGVGIQDDLKEKLFAPNFTTKSSGMGIGLAIVKRIVESSNGKIWFISKEGEGTTFFIEYPLLYSNSN